MGHASTDTDSDAADGDLAWCHDIVQEVSRTFAITIEVLEEPMSSAICVGYLLCRIPDTIEDADHIPPTEQRRLLETYDEVLDPATDTPPAAFVEAAERWVPEGDRRDADWELVARTERVFRAFDARPADVRAAIRPPAREMVGGMAEFVARYADAGGLRIRTREELHEYCYYAAGTVGDLVTNLVCSGETPAEVREPLEANAESFGLALQLTNICKDVGADFHGENNVYLPADELAAEGVDQEGICEPANREGVVTVVERTVADAREFLDDARTYLEHVPERRGNRVAAWAIPYLLAVGTLREIESRPEDVLRPEGVKVSREEVAAVIDATVGGVDAARLADLHAAISEGALGREV